MLTLENDACARGVLLSLKVHLTSRLSNDDNVCIFGKVYKFSSLIP